MGFPWIGKKTVDKAVTGIGKWIDEQQFTPQEQLEMKLKFFEVMHPFKQIQRVIMTTLLYHWAFVGVNCILAIWLESVFPTLEVFDKLVTYATLDFVWMPTLAGFTLYLTGGLSFAKNKKD